MIRAYTDNTNAADPPGGKRHNPSLARETLLPPEQGFEKTSRTNTNRKKPAPSERGTGSRAK